MNYFLRYGWKKEGIITSIHGTQNTWYGAYRGVKHDIVTSSIPPRDPDWFKEYLKNYLDYKIQEWEF